MLKVMISFVILEIAKNSCAGNQAQFNHIGTFDEHGHGKL